VPLYDPQNPLYASPPDLRDIIDRFAEGGMGGFDEDAGEYEDPYQGVTEQYAEPRHSSHDTHDLEDQTPENVFNPDGTIKGRAATFATAQDLRRFQQTRSLAQGDNGRGYWGHNTAGSTPYAAIPRDLLRKVYGHENRAKGKFVEVTAPNGNVAVVEIGDVGPMLRGRRVSRYPRNNAVIELNTPATQLLGSGDASGYSYRFLDQQ
jgi:hypothetical protein